MENDYNKAISILATALAYYHNDTKALISLLHTIAGFDSSIITQEPFMKTIAATHLFNDNDLVKEQALYFFDNHGTTEDVALLRNAADGITTQWINDYRIEIIESITRRASGESDNKETERL